MLRGMRLAQSDARWFGNQTCDVPHVRQRGESEAACPVNLPKSVPFSTRVANISDQVGVGKGLPVGEEAFEHYRRRSLIGRRSMGKG
jgi:hypothetical protein